MQITAPIVLSGKPAKASAVIVGDPANAILVDVQVFQRGRAVLVSPGEYGIASRALYAACAEMVNNESRQGQAKSR
ncbi:hypothetical protein [Motiliproteus sp. MSK22-1]|uniref:hypothetical protein n=1 Tax=Motiliproteus sp. MSK22-1 TaxID=1897630 RepID=UPI0009767B5F|nr:hypothetical protein [Motiliproteus sp. MSK22-1]OMH32644.1 hypothetical protein BGP75_13940 [Motiliproteus sp. MSK22-1]